MWREGGGCALRGAHNAGLTLGKDPAPHHPLRLSHFLKIQEDIPPWRALPSLRSPAEAPPAAEPSLPRCLKHVSAPPLPLAFLRELEVSEREEKGGREQHGRLWCLGLGMCDPCMEPSLKSASGRRRRQCNYPQAPAGGAPSSPEWPLLSLSGLSGMSPGEGRRPVGCSVAGGQG